MYHVSLSLSNLHATNTTVKLQSLKPRSLGLFVPYLLVIDNDKSEMCGTA